MNRTLFFVFLVAQEYFLGINGIPSFVAKGIAFVVLFIAIMMSDYKEMYYRRMFGWLLVCIILNMVWCSMNREQSPIEYFIGNEFTSMLTITGIFAIPAFKLTDEEIEHTLVALGVTCVALYLVQYIFHVPITIDSDSDAIAASGLKMRVRMNGQCLFPFIILYSITKLIDGFNPKYLGLLVASALCMLIIGFRSQLAAIMGVTALFIWKSGLLKGKIIPFVLMIAITGSIALHTDVVQFKINQIAERNETDNFNDDDYVRLRTYEYYTEEAPNNVIDKILGIGLPNGNSKYGAEIQAVKAYGIIWADWGLIGLSWVLGIPAVLCIIWYMLYAFLTPVSNRYSYLCYWCLYMVLASILTREIYREGAFPIQAVVLFLIAQVRTGDAFIDYKNMFRKKEDINNDEDCNLYLYGCK